MRLPFLVRRTDEFQTHITAKEVVDLGRELASVLDKPSTETVSLCVRSHYISRIFFKENRPDVTAEERINATALTNWALPKGFLLIWLEAACLEVCYVLLI
jgi:hypothetical protein